MIRATPMHKQVLDSKTVEAAGVGDINSNERGSGARFNAGKPALELIPASIFAEYHARKTARPFPHPAPYITEAMVRISLCGVEAFQMREQDRAYRGCLLDALIALDYDGRIWADCARVFDYGRAKYAAWNWAKGMAWSIPVGCILRHIVFGLMSGEETDPESGLPHRGHIACNIVMLLWFMHEYPEGDDRPEVLQS